MSVREYAHRIDAGAGGTFVLTNYTIKGSFHQHMQMSLCIIQYLKCCSLEENSIQL